MTRTVVGIVRNQQGFGMAEVLVAILVFSAALLALGKFQSDLLQTGRSAKARVIAAELVQEKLDDLRSFSQLSTGSGTIVFGYSDIDNDAGGTKALTGGDVFDVLLPAVSSLPLSLSGVDFSRTWSVVDWWYCDDGTPQELACSGEGTDPYSDYKVVTLTVAWTEPDGTAESIVQAGTIYAADPKASGHALAISYPDGPIYYSPESGSVPIDADNGQKKVTDLPIVQKVGPNDEYTIVTINEAVYKYGHLSKSSFVTVNCDCRHVALLNTSGGSEVNQHAMGYPPLQQIISGDYVASGDDYVLPSERKKVIKWNGVVSGDQQPKLCEDCCRDHHDRVVDENSMDIDTLVDPFMPTTSVFYDFEPRIAGHKHYSSEILGGQWVLDKVKTEDRLYLDACRFKVIDGDEYLMQDWNLVKVTVMPADYLETHANLESYQSYVSDFIEKYADDNSSSNSSYPETQEYPEVVWYDEPDDEDSMEIDEKKQYQVRGIYIDYMDSGIRSSIASGNLAIPAALFHEINITYLADWDLIPSLGGATVTNEALKDNSTHSRGEVSSISGGKMLWVESEPGNTGLTNTILIDPDQEISANNMHDCLGINMDSRPMIRGVMSNHAHKPTKLEDVQITWTEGGGVEFCEISAEANKYGKYEYVCLLSPDNGEFTIEFSNYHVRGKGIEANTKKYLCPQLEPSELVSTETKVVRTIFKFNNVEKCGIIMDIRFQSTTIKC